MSELMNVRSQVDPFLYRSFSRQDELKNKVNRYGDQEGGNKFEELLSKQLSKEDMSKQTPERELPARTIDPELYSKVGTSNFQLRLNREAVVKETMHNPEKKKLYDAAISFEAFFMEKVFKEMKKSNSKDKLIDGGFAEEVFDEMLLTERIGQMVNHQEFGLAETIYHQLTRF